MPPTFLEDWNARHLNRYYDQLARGLHDDDCEQRERSSLCHCSKRTRERDGKTTLPGIEFPAPVCNGCGDDVECDGDSFRCENCHVEWARDASDGGTADHFTDDYGPEPIGGEQFGRRLIDLAV